MRNFSCILRLTFRTLCLQNKECISCFVYDLLHWCNRKSPENRKCRCSYFLKFSFLLWRRISMYKILFPFDLFNHSPIVWTMQHYCIYMSGFCRCCCNHGISCWCPSCYLDLLDKLQKRIGRIIGPYLLLLLNPWLIVEMWPV